MVDRQDRIPTWVGKAVTAAELSRLPAGTEDRATEGEGFEPERPANASKLEESIHVGHFGQADPGDGDTGGSHDSAPGRIDGSALTPWWRSTGLIGAALAVLLLVVVAATVLPRAGDGDSSDIAADVEVSDETGPALPEERAAADSDFGAASSTMLDVGDGVDPWPAIEDSDAWASDEDPGVARGFSADSTIPGVSAAAMEFHQKTALANGQSAWAVYSDGRVYLQGTLPDRTVADLLTSRLEALLGAGNVIEQLTIEEPGIAPTDPPLFIKETVVFAPDSAAMPPGSDWILVIADVLMNRYPSTTLTVVANGSNTEAGITSDLQRQRGQAIVDYLMERGIDGSRLGYEYRDEGTFGGDTGNKPIEFVVRGLVEAATGSSRIDG